MPRRGRKVPGRPRPAPRRADSQHIVEAILVAAVALGPRASSNEIAGRAGVGIASLYRYFPSTEAIFAEVSRRMFAGFLEHVRTVLANPALPLAAKVRGVCRAALDGGGVPFAHRQQIALHVPLWWTKESADDVNAATISECAAWLRQNVPQAPANLEGRLFVIMASIRGVVLMSLVHPTLAPTTEEMVDLLTASIFTALELHERP